MSQCILEHCHAEGKNRTLFFWVKGTKHKYHLYAEDVPMCKTCKTTSERETGEGGSLICDFQWENISKLPPSTDGSYRSPVKLLRMAFRKPNAPKSAFLR